MEQLKVRLQETLTEKKKLGKRYRFLDALNKNLECILRRKNEEIKQLRLGREEKRGARKQKDVRAITKKTKITHYFPVTTVTLYPIN